MYYEEHKDLGITVCAKNLGTSRIALFDWIKKSKNNKGEVPTRGYGNYQSDEGKENVRLHKELRDTQDALEILHQGWAVPKKRSSFWENNKGSIY